MSEVKEGFAMSEDEKEADRIAEASEGSKAEIVSGVGGGLGMKRLTNVPALFALGAVGLFSLVFFYSVNKRFSEQEAKTPESIETVVRPANRMVAQVLENHPEIEIMEERAPELSPDPREEYAHVEAVSFTDEIALREEQEVAEFHMEQRISAMRLAARKRVDAENAVSGLKTDGMLIEVSDGFSFGVSAPVARRVAELALPVVPALGAQASMTIDDVSEDSPYLDSRVEAAVSPYAVLQGSVIPAILVTGINSDLEGNIVAQVSQDVFDTVSGGYLLIPQGSRLFGSYEKAVVEGQQRVLVVWERIIFADGTSLRIGGMGGSDMSGASGLKDRVNSHFWRTYGEAAMLSAISAGMEASRDSGDNDRLADAVRRTFGETFGEIASEGITASRSAGPTLEVRSGYRLLVLVEKDMVLRPR